MFTKKSISRAFSVLFILMMMTVLIGSAAFPTSVRAFGATITVTTNADNTTVDSQCSLREAITNANNNAATYADCGSGLAGSGDVIFFSNGLGSATITLLFALPTISDSTGLTINGGDDITVSGNDLYRVFLVSGAPLTLDSLTITHGKVTSGTGGGVFNASGMLTLINCFFSSNSAADGNGGGLYSIAGTLTITDSIFSGNTATKVVGGGYGGGVYNFSPTTITRTIFSGNSANIRGGGLYNYFSTTTITDSTFSSNSMSSAGDGAGGIYNDGGTLTITHSTFSSNAANSSGSNGGAIFNNNLGELTITLSTFYNNSVTTGVGGGIASNGTVTVGNSTFSNNWADYGAGIYNGIGGTLTSTNNTFSGNSTFFTSVFGGGIYNEGTLNLYNTILANTVNGGDCYKSAANGTVIGTNNLIESASANACGLTNGVSGNIIGSDPNLGPLTLLNPTYFPLNAGSLAINAGNNAKCTAAPVNGTSQNGLTRPQEANCDIGSYEAAPVTAYTLFLPLILR